MTLNEMDRLQMTIEPEPEDYSIIFPSSSSPEPNENVRGSMNQNDSLEKTNPKPTWFPARSSRSVVWEHIHESDEPHRVTCNYCTAEFQIKGGTSAVLRHLKTNHPKCIDYDPENPPPTKRKKKNGDESIIVSDDTKEYMDNLLKHFFLPDADDSSAQSQKETEIGSMKNQRQEPTDNPSTAENQDKLDEVDRDIRMRLGLLEDQPFVIEAIEVDSRAIRGDLEKSKNEPPSRPILAQHLSRPSRNVSARSGSQSPLQSQNGKRKNAGTDKFGEKPKFSRHNLQNMAGGDFAPNLHNISNPPAFPLTNSDVDMETKLLYNQSLQANIMREHTVARYYALKSKKIELEIRKLEIECEAKAMNWSSTGGEYSSSSN